MKTDLKDVSFIIHYRKDTDCREFNLKTIVNYLTTQAEIDDIIIINDTAELDQNVIDIIKDHSNIRLHWLKNDGNFRKSHSFNIGAGMSKYDILCFYDVDILIPVKFLHIAKTVIQSDEVDHIYPYSGLFIDIAKSHFDNFIPTFDFDYLNNNKDNEGFSVAATNSHGGCNLISKSKFVDMKGFDEQFVGWGFEDTDFYARSLKQNKVGYIKEEDAICWHLHHENAIRTDSPDYNNNLAYYFNGNRK